MQYELVVVGSSWGGLHALQAILRDLPADFAAPMVIAQHRSARSDDTLLPMLLDATTALTVRDAEDKAALTPGLVLIAPPDYHLLVEQGTVALSCDAPVAFSRPSIDVLFESAADAYGDRVVGVVLTGANADGATGLSAIRRSGGLALVQDPATAERSEMPAAALRAVPDAHVVALDEVGAQLASAVGTVAREGRR
jgi:two-component system, chemotaxis family, protein-glutamate methylesterase/glutaminase